MATLTEFAFYTRKVIKYGLFIFIGLFLGKIILDMTVSLWKKLHPAPVPAPTVSFGKLPIIQFPQKEKQSGLEFVLETPTGTLTNLPDRANVYFMPYLKPSLLALDRAKNQAALMGFKNEPKTISEKIYQWTRAENSLSTLEMDIFSGSFILSYDWQNDPNIFLEKSLPGKEQAKTETQNFLQNADIAETDLINGRVEVNYLKVVGGKLNLAMSPSEANFAKIDIFRKNVGDLPILTSDPQKGIVSFLISGTKQLEKRIIKVEFNYFPIKYDSLATYPIKKATIAWQELKAGQAFISQWDSTGNRVVIRKIYLAYYDSEKPQQFLQPIIVFEGDNNFSAYISAISPEWTL